MKRETCRLCGSPHLTLICPLEPIPASENFLKDKKQSSELPRYGISLYQCVECMHLQQSEWLDPGILWSKYSYYSGKTPNMRAHFEDEHSKITNLLADKIQNRRLLEIGSNDGTFMSVFKENGWSVVGIDPAPGPVKACRGQGMNAYNDYFSKAYEEEIQRDLGGPPTLVLMYNAFAHMDNVDTVLRDIVDILDPEEGFFRFEVQYAKSLIEKGLIASIFHEHINHYSLISLSRFLGKFGLYIYDARIVDIQHGSLVVTAAHFSKREKIGATAEAFSLLVEEANSGTVYPSGSRMILTRLENDRERIRSLLSEGRFKRVSGYGAARSASTILTQYALRKIVDVIFDDDASKTGLYLGGDEIMILNSNSIEEFNPDLIIILAWVHTSHILSRLKDYIEGGGSVLSIYPEVCIHKKGHE